MAGYVAGFRVIRRRCFRSGWTSWSRRTLRCGWWTGLWTASLCPPSFL